MPDEQREPHPRAHRLPSGSASPALVEHEVDLGEAEAGQLDIELEVDQRLQLDREDLLVPAGVERQLVVGEHIGAALGVGEVRQRAASAPTSSPSSLAASTRPWPAMISPSSETSTGLVNPNRSMLAAICLICFFEWVRALRA